MDVLVERFQRRKIVSDKDSPMLFYLRQKPRSSGTVDVDTLAASIQKNCAMTKGETRDRSFGGRNSGDACQWRQSETGSVWDISHDVPLFGRGENGGL